MYSIIRFLKALVAAMTMVQSDAQLAMATFEGDNRVSQKSWYGQEFWSNLLTHNRSSAQRLLTITLMAVVLIVILMAALLLGFDGGGIGLTTAASLLVTKPEPKEETMNNDVLNLDMLLERKPTEWFLKSDHEVAIRLGHEKILLIDLDERIVTYLSAEGAREIAWKGQGARIKHLLDLMKYPEENKGRILASANSIVRFNMEMLDVDMVMVDRDLDVLPHLREVEGYSVRPLATGLIVRRTCAAADPYLNVKLVKFVDSAKYTDDEVLANINEAMDNITNVHQIEEIAGFGVKNDPAFLDEVLEHMFPAYIKAGYQLLGGNPDAGLLVFQKNPGVKVAENGQKLAKLLLRGGIHLSEGDSFEATLVDFNDDIDSSSINNPYRDGVFMIAKRGIMSAWARLNGFHNGTVWQSTFFVPGVSGMKGLVLAANGDMIESLRMLGRNDAVIDRASYCSYYGLDLPVGTKVTVDPSMMYVMGTSGEKGNRKRGFHVSGQLVRRAPAALSRWFARINKIELAKRIRAARSNDKRDLLDYLPKFGQYKKLQLTGMRPMLKRIRYNNKQLQEARANGVDLPQFEVDPYLAKTLQGDIVRGVRKGYMVDGNGEYWVHDSSMVIDTGDQVPGIALPNTWGYKEGDLVVVIRYPILPALDEEGRSTGVTMMRVTRLNKSDIINVNPVVAKFMLGDEDGDQVIVLPADPKLPEIGLAHMGLSTRKENTSKNKLFKAALDSGIAENSLACLKVFMRLGTDVGIVDNRVSSLVLYMDADEEYETPTGESITVYLSKTIQASIESKKHQTDELYSIGELTRWAREAVPAAFDEDGKFKVHPELKVAKTTDSKGTYNHVTLEDIAKALYESDEVQGSEWLEFIQLSLNWRLTDNGFVRPDYYHAAGVRLYKEIKRLVTNIKTRKSIGETAQQIYRNAVDIAKTSGWDAAKAYLKMAGLELSMTMPTLEWLMLQSQMLFISKNGSPFTYLNFNDVSFLRLMSEYAEDGDADPKMFGYTKRNKTSKTREYTAPESGIKRIRAFVHDPMMASEVFAEGQKLALMGENGGVILDTAIPFGVGSKDQTTGQFVVKSVEPYGTADKSMLLYLEG
jgi:hypothetical protein